jgi:hypothetical protein
MLDFVQDSKNLALRQIRCDGGDVMGMSDERGSQRALADRV